MTLELGSLLNSYNFFRDSICCPKCTKRPKSDQGYNYNENIFKLKKNRIRQICPWN